METTDEAPMPELPPLAATPDPAAYAAEVMVRSMLDPHGAMFSLAMVQGEHLRLLALYARSITQGVQTMTGALETMKAMSDRIEALERQHARLERRLDLGYDPGDETPDPDDDPDG